MIYKTLYKKLKIDQHEPTKKTVGELMSSRIPAPLVASVMLLSSDLVISQEWGKGGTVITTNETYPLSFLG
jgi:hypothetical protein